SSDEANPRTGPRIVDPQYRLQNMLLQARGIQRLDRICFLRLLHREQGVPLARKIHAQLTRSAHGRMGRFTKPETRPELFNEARGMQAVEILDQAMKRFDLQGIGRKINGRKEIVFLLAGMPEIKFPPFY